MAVRYLTAPVKDDQAALARQRTYLDALCARGGTVEIILGRHQTKSRQQTKKVTCRLCGNVFARLSGLPNP